MASSSATRSAPKSCSVSLGSSASAIVPRTSGIARDDVGVGADRSAIASSKPTSPRPSVTSSCAGPAISSIVRAEVPDDARVDDVDRDDQRDAGRDAADDEQRPAPARPELRIADQAKKTEHERTIGAVGRERSKRSRSRRPGAI